MLPKSLLEILRHSPEGPFERVADAIKDAILDWELPSDDDHEMATALPDELLPMAPADFVDALRGPMEEVLWQLAEALNEAPTGQIVEASEHRMAELLLALYGEAVREGLRLRIEATQADLPPAQLPQGRWAKKYRTMRAAGVALPPYDEVN